MHLLDLTEDLLIAFAIHLPFDDRLQLSGVCRKLRDLSKGPSKLWSTVDVARALRGPCREARRREAAELAEGFASWLRPRAAAVERIVFAAYCVDELAPLWPTLFLPRLLFPPPEPDDHRALLPTPLTRLAIEWPGCVMIDPLPTPLLPCLRKLAFHGGTQLVIGPSCLLPPTLTDFGQTDGQLPGVGAPAALDRPWLPPSLTALALSNVGLHRLPGVLTHLPVLRSLVVGQNRLGSAPLDALLALTRLEELNLSECSLRAFPTQVSALTTLRVLYLHNAWHRTAQLAPADWDALRPLRRLAFLSISSAGLRALPPAVAAMSQLQAMHVEDNDLVGGLPLGPYLPGLQELLLDWQAALDSPAALRCATRLTRLLLSNHRACDEDAGSNVAPAAAAAGAGAGPGAAGGGGGGGGGGSAVGVRIRPASAAEPLLAALAALPALRCVADIFGEEDAVTAPVAHAMWQLGRRCPGVQLSMADDTNVGWDLAHVERAEAAAAAAGAAGAGAGAGAGLS